MTLSTSAVAVCCCRDFAQIISAAPDLVEQTDVFDRDHRLVGERGDESNLLLSEWLHALTRQYDHADRLILSQNGTPRAVR